MVSHWLITGDCHGQFGRFKNLDKTPNTAIIILGDVGLNYNLNESDFGLKKGLTKKYPFMFYCVRGNHEARPSEQLGMHRIYDENVGIEIAKRRIKTHPLGQLKTEMITSLCTDQVKFILFGELKYVMDNIDKFINENN